MTSTLSPQQFVAKWRSTALKERSASPSHFSDLCARLGLPAPVEADPADRWYTFEAGAAKTGMPTFGKLASLTLAQGWADVWKMGYFVSSQ